MAGYKDAEIEAAVSRFVQSTIRIEKDALGPVDIGSKFNEVLQLISSALVYDPNAIFYIVYLATNKLNVTVELALEYIEDVSDAIDEMGHHTKDVTRTTLLGDAAAALLAVDQILTDNSTISSRAFTRYQQAVDDFTRVSLEPNIKQSGQVVRPPQLARQDVLITIPNLSTAYVAILGTLAQVRLMLDEFNDLNLGVLSIQNSVQKVRDDLRTLQSQFENTSTTRDDKIALCREAYLSIASGKSVLNNFTTVSDPSDPRLSSSSTVVGYPSPSAGDEGELVSASITCTKSAPWEITASADELKVAEDGESEKTYAFTPPSQPSVTSIFKDSYDIPASGRLEIDGLPAVGLTPGVNLTAEVVNSINTWATTFPTYPYTASDDGGYIKITKTTPGANEIRMTAEADIDDVLATYQVLGFYEGQTDSSTGLSAAEAAAVINAAGSIAASVVLTRYENGDDGEVKSGALTVLEVAENSIESFGHADDMLLVRTGINVGYRRIVSVTRVGGVDKITVDSSTPFKVVDTELSWVILSERLKLASTATDLTTELTIGAGNVNSVMGFSEETVVGTTTGFRAKEGDIYLDFSHLDVVVGDIVRVVNATPDPDVSSEHTVLELSSSNGQLEITPSIDTNTVVGSFSILSAAAVAYEILVAALDAWDDLLAASEFSEDILELERVMNPLIANKNPSISQLNDARSTLLALEALLTNTSPDGLTEILQAFQVSLVPRVDASLKMLKERGMDRAYDLLMDGKIETFFSMDKDDASSSAYMLKSMRGVVRSDLRVSKLTDDADDTTHIGSAVGTDPDYDYSDADSDENVKLLGEGAYFDSEGDTSKTSKARY